MASNSITLLVGVISFTGGILASFGLYFLRERRRKLNLRRALFVEVQVPAAAIEDLSEIATELDGDEMTEASNGSNDTEPFRTEIPTAVYEAHINDIGLLSKQELEAVVEYYATATIAKEQLSNITDDGTKRRFLKETVPPLNQSRKTAEEKLGTQLPFTSTLDRIISLYGRVAILFLIVVVTVAIMEFLLCFSSSVCE